MRVGLRWPILYNMKTTTTADATTNLEGLVLLFNNCADPSRAARLHAPDCNMVHTAGKSGRGKVNLITTDLAANVEDLNEREFPVKLCKCCAPFQARAAR